MKSMGSRRGDEVGMVDLVVWPWFEMLAVLGPAVPEVDPQSSAFPQLHAWCQNMRALPSVASQLSPYELDY